MARFGFNDKDIEKIAEQAVAEGWRVEITKGNHVKWLAPEGVLDHRGKRLILISALTGSRRGWQDHKAALRRAGLSCVQSKHQK